MGKFKNLRYIAFCLITTFALAMALTACGNKKDSPEQTGGTAETDVKSVPDAADENSETASASADAKIDYKTSELYSREDMDAAIKKILAEFNTWEGCTLYEISYTDDQKCTDNLSYIKTLNTDKKYDECIVFTSNFHSPKEGGGAWEPDYDYENWEWYLGRVKGEDWELLTWGY